MARTITDAYEEMMNEGKIKKLPTMGESKSNKLLLEQLPLAKIELMLEKIMKHLNIK